MKMQLKLRMKVWPLLLPPCRRLKTGKPLIITGVKTNKKNCWRGEVSHKTRVVTKTHSNAIILRRTQGALTMLQKRPLSVWKLQGRHTKLSVSVSHCLCVRHQNICAEHNFSDLHDCWYTRAAGLLDHVSCDRVGYHSLVDRLAAGCQLLA